jgi:hypothetical protein
MSRWLMVRPLLAGSGLVPAKVANAASSRYRPGWEKLMITWAALRRRLEIGEPGKDHEDSKLTLRWQVSYQHEP